MKTTIVDITRIEYTQAVWIDSETFEERHGYAPVAVLPDGERWLLPFIADTSLSVHIGKWATRHKGWVVRSLGKRSGRWSFCLCQAWPVAPLKLRLRFDDNYPHCMDDADAVKGRINL